MTDHSPSCERARLRASLLLDGELAELEERALAAHLRACPACAAFARGVEEMTAALRTAPAENLAVAVVPSHGGGRKRRRRLTEVSSAAAALLLVVTGTTVLFADRTPPESTRSPESLLSPFYADPNGVDAAEQVREDNRKAIYRRNVQMPESSKPIVPGPIAS